MSMNNEVWKEFAAQEVTHSVAHYLTTIQDLRQKKGYAILKDVADDLQVTKGSASVQIKNLKERGLVSEVDRHHLCLTEDGEKVAMQVVYNREVVTNFFHKVLGISYTSAEIDACKIEHLLSHEASQRILSLLQLLSQDDPVVTGFLKKFNNFTATCPDHENCEVCEETCLEEL
tara:strand:- start:1525 stop:2046 length:522 start_codon:yes stop_codon:yes gene_type:complete